MKRNIKSIRQLVRLPDDKRRALLRSLSDEQYRDLLNVCTAMPTLSISYRCEVSLVVLLGSIEVSDYPLFLLPSFINILACVIVIIGRENRVKVK